MYEVHGLALESLAMEMRAFISDLFCFSSRRRHTRFDCDWSSECALPICRKSGSASSTTTCAPSRRHTLPSSSPITPAPMTPRRFGTASRSSAPQESTMCGGLKGAERDRKNVVEGKGGDLGGRRVIKEKRV